MFVDDTRFHLYDEENPFVEVDLFSGEFNGNGEIITDNPEVIRHHVQVPSSRFPLNDEGFTLLQSMFDPNSVTLANLINAFVYVKSQVANLLLQ